MLRHPRESWSVAGLERRLFEAHPLPNPALHIAVNSTQMPRGKERSDRQHLETLLVELQ